MAKINDAIQLLSELTSGEKSVIAERLYSGASSHADLSSDSFMLSTRFQNNICCVKCGSISVILYETKDKAVTLNVNIDGDTVWLNRNQLSELFDRDVKAIGKHINNALYDRRISS